MLHVGGHRKRRLGGVHQVVDKFCFKDARIHLHLLYTTVQPSTTAPGKKIDINISLTGRINEFQGDPSTEGLKDLFGS